MEILEQVESYLARTRVPSSTFGRVVVGDPGFVRDLRAGRHPRRGRKSALGIISNK